MSARTAGKESTMSTPTLRRALAALAAATLGATAALAQQGATPRAFEQLTYPPLHDITPPQVVRDTLPNGMRLLLVEDHELPGIELKAFVHGGRVVEPPGKPRPGRAVRRGPPHRRDPLHDRGPARRGARPDRRLGRDRGPRGARRGRRRVPGRDRRHGAADLRRAADGPGLRPGQDRPRQGPPPRGRSPQRRPLSGSRSARSSSSSTARPRPTPASTSTRTSTA